MSKFIEGLLTLVFVFLAACVIALVLAFPLMYLWNDLMPYLFEWKKLSLYQALELSAICSLLFQSASYGSKSK